VHVRELDVSEVDRAEGIDGLLERLRAHGAELVGALEQYENIYRLCYIRGPEGIIIELAEEIGQASRARQ